MLSYHNDPAVKAKYVNRFAAHRAADEVIQGQGFDNGRGCFVGCTLNNYSHERFPIELGWPEWLARLADRIFEGIPANEAPQFGTDLLEAVPVGIDLEPIRYRFLLTVQQRNLARLAGNTEPYAVECRAAIQGVIAYLESPEKLESAESAAWSAAESAAESAESAAESAESAAWSAWSAAESAAWSAAWSAAESAAWSAAESAARSAESAARSAAWSARSAESAARSAAWSAWSAAEYRTQRDDLLAMIRELRTV